MERYLAMPSAEHQAPFGAYWSRSASTRPIGFWQIGLGLIERMIGELEGME